MHITIRFQLQILRWINVGLKISEALVQNNFIRAIEKNTVISNFTADTEKSRLTGSGRRQASLKAASKKGKKVDSRGQGHGSEWGEGAVGDMDTCNSLIN